MQGPLDFEEEIIAGHSRELYPSRLKRGLDTGHQPAELGNQAFVFAAATRDALRCRWAEAAAAHLLLPLKIGRLMMNSCIPDKVKVQKMAQVKSVRILLEPCVLMFSIQSLQDPARVFLLPVVAGNQVASALGDFKASLHPQRALRQGPDKGLKGELRAIPFLIARVVRVDATDRVAGHEGAIYLDEQVIDDIAHLQLLTKRRLSHRLRMVLDGQRHRRPQSFRYSRISSRSRSR